MHTKHFIAGDWGTSHLRLYLRTVPDGGSSGRTIATHHGPGISRARGAIEETFSRLSGAWFSKFGPMPVILSGMAGSSLGWRQTPYLQCPARVTEIASAHTVLEAAGTTITIVHGLRTENPLHMPDLIRGEELQLLGWAQQSHPEQSRLLAFPGTHNKWVLLENGCVQHFITALTGEVFTTLSKNGVLIEKAGQGPPRASAAFEEGVASITMARQAGLLHALFSTRSRQIEGTLKATDAPDYLSGLLIGADVNGALALFRDQVPDLSSVTVIGERAISECYRTVLQKQGLDVELYDGTEAAVAGYDVVYRHLMKTLK